MTDIQLFSPGKAFQDSYKRSRGTTLAGLAINSQGEQRQSALSQLAGLNPVVAQSMKKDLDEQERAELGEAAAMLNAAPPEMREPMYQRVSSKFAPRLQALGGTLPATYAEAEPFIQQIARSHGGGGKQAPSDVQSFEYFSKGMTPDDRAQAMRYKLGLDQKPSADVKPLPNGGMMYEDSKTGKVFVMNPGDTSWREFSLPGRQQPQATVEQADYTQEVDAGTNVPATAGYSPSEREAYENVRANGGHWRAEPTGAVKVSGGLPNLSTPKAEVVPSGYRMGVDGRSLEPIPGGPADPASKPSKPWTPAGLAKYNEVRTDVQVATTLNTMMDDMTALFNDAAFELGPIHNKKYEALNWAGQSTPQSQAYAKLKSNFEKMRNDSLRLNKGVQTDGDAQRAWNEILQNMNDKELVKARLTDIKRYNEFALNEKQLQMENFTAEFGAPGGRKPAAQAPSGGSVWVRDANGKLILKAK